MSSPNPNWKPGDKITAPSGEMITFDASKIEAPEIYKLMIGAIIPRPIAFVSTLSKDGVGNLAPYSFFNGVASNPPCLMISSSNKPNGEGKDTLRNIEETGQFVVNSANEWLAEPLVQTSGDYPYGVNEMAVVGLTPLPSVKVKPPRVKEAAVQMECELYKSVKIGDGSRGSSTVIFGKILMIHVNQSVMKDGKISWSDLKPLGRLGGFGYTKLGDTFSIPTPKLQP